MFLKRMSSLNKVHGLNLFMFISVSMLLAGFAFFAIPAFAADPGLSIFEQKCKACHTIGGGRLVGPDLRGVTSNRDTEWLVRFITTPDKVIAGGDSIAQQLVQQYSFAMPNLGLTEGDAKAVLAYIDAQSTGSALTAAPTIQPVSAPQPATASSSNDADTGKGLFTGTVALTNGGPACLSCHNISTTGFIGGGTVGKDLTNAYSTMGEAAIGSILKTTPFPMMKQIYTAKPLADNEISSLLTFLKSTGSAPSASGQNSPGFFIIGGAGALLIIGVFQWLWRGRLSGVRRTLVKGGSK